MALKNLLSNSTVPSLGAMQGVTQSPVRLKHVLTLAVRASEGKDFY